MNSRDAAGRSHLGEAVLVALAVLLQLTHDRLGYDAGFMRVDLAGVPALIALGLLGMRSAVCVLAATGIVILLADSSHLVGASFKVSATATMLLALAWPRRGLVLPLALLAAFLIAGGTSLLLGVLGAGVIVVGTVVLAFPAVAVAVGAIGTEPGTPPRWFFTGQALALAVLLRGSLMILADAFFAGPVFFRTPPAELLSALPPWRVFAWNAVQALVDVLSASCVVAVLRPRRSRPSPPAGGGAL